MIIGGELVDIRGDVMDNWWRSAGSLMVKCCIFGGKCVVVLNGKWWISGDRWWGTGRSLVGN
jgi:hypothetical protein